MNPKSKMVIAPSGKNVMCVGERKLIVPDQSQPILAEFTRKDSRDLLSVTKNQSQLKGMIAQRESKLQSHKFTEDPQCEQASVKKLK